MLAVIRFVLLFIAFLLINFVVLLVCLARPFHRDNVFFAGQAYSQMAKILGLEIRLIISPEVKRNEPYVFVANHQNSYDIITICKAALPGVVTVGKKSLKWIPIFGQIYWLSGNIMIDRKNRGKAHNTLDSAAAKIRQKKTSVWVFPEGTRSNGKGLLPFKTGAFHIAKKTGEAVVTVCASNMHKKIDWNRWNNGILLVSVDAPTAIDETMTPKECATFFHQKMNERISELNAQVAELEKTR